MSLVEAQPFQGKKKGADTGIDGVNFSAISTGREGRKILVSVKGGGIKPDGGSSEINSPISAFSRSRT